MDAGDRSDATLSAFALALVEAEQAGWCWEGEFIEELVTMARRPDAPTIVLQHLYEYLATRPDYRCDNPSAPAQLMRPHWMRQRFAMAWWPHAADVIRDRIAADLRDAIHSARTDRRKGEYDEYLAMLRAIAWQDQASAAQRSALEFALSKKSAKSPTLTIDDDRRDVSSDAAALNGVGLQLGKFGRHEDAAKCFTAAIAADPSNADVYLNLGVALVHLFRLGDAISALTKAITSEKWGNEATAWLYAAQCLDGRAADADATLKRLSERGAGTTRATDLRKHMEAHKAGKAECSS